MKTITVLLLCIISGHHCIAQQADTSSYKTDTLQAVTVVASSPLVIQKADRIVYDLQADPQSKVSSLLDMMRKVPYLSVDGNDNVLLKGSSGYRVFINGRPSALVESDPKDVLRSIPASTIRSIELITNPPAKYDAEGLAGIINIVTTRQIFNGYKASINAYENGPVGGPGIGCSFTSKISALGISIIAGSNQQQTPATEGHLTRTTSGSKPMTLQRHTLNENNSHTTYAGIDLSYEIDSLDLLSAEFSWRNNGSTDTTKQSSSLTDPTVNQYYKLNNSSNNKNEDMDVTLNYQKGFKAAEEQLLNLSYRYLELNNTLNNDITFTNDVNFNQPNYRQYNVGDLAEHAVQADYAQPVNRLMIELGSKASARINKTEFQYSTGDTVSGRYEADPARSNNFSTSRNILAAYASCAYESANWQIKAGIRVEETIIRMGYDDAGTLRQQYRNILPSIFITRKFNDNTSLQWTYSKRLQRPTTAELNPFVDRSDPNFEFSGNPYLRPITSDAYQLSYMRSAKATLNISFCAWYFRHVFSPVPFYNAATGITAVRQENYGNGRVIKTNIYWNYPVTPKLTVGINSDIRHVKVTGGEDGVAIKNSGFCVYINASGGYGLDKGWRLNADLTYQMGGIRLPLGQTNSYLASSLSINKSLLQSKLTISGAVNNPFTRYRHAEETVTASDFVQSSTTRSYYRWFTFGLNYRFGKLTEEIRKNKKEMSKED